MIRLAFLLGALLATTASAQEHPDAQPGSSWSDILDLNDRDAAVRLHAMTQIGKLTTKELAEAWIVLASVAQGAGLEHCGFPMPDDLSFLSKPALDGMTSEEIFTLNRIVTSNYRNAEKSGKLRLRLLFPVTRQAVLILSTPQGNYNCREVTKVWTAGRNYVRARGQ
jgi:hypothetical protein